MRHLTVGEMAKLNHISEQTLRLYDKRGLLSPSFRGQNGYRYYDIKQSAVLDIIQYMKSLGISLKEIKHQLENRDLAQKPAFSIASVVSKQNPWMVQYEAYVKDQIAFRDGWIDLKSYAEAALLKTENNDVYYGEDGYLFKQLLGVDESRFARNVTALANLCERHPGIVKYYSRRRGKKQEVNAIF